LILTFDPEAYVDTLTVGERQQLEILRLLWLGAQVLILDEPTTGISALQKAKLFETLRKLAGRENDHFCFPQAGRSGTALSPGGNPAPG
jgi:ABC-type uncharacterized transport system ATPase subunit